MSENVREGDQLVRSDHRVVWTPAAIRNLGAVTNIETAASILGIGRTKAYELAKSDEFPVHLLHIGRRIIVPVAEIIALLEPSAPGPRVKESSKHQVDARVEHSCAECGLKHAPR